MPNSCSVREHKDGKDKCLHGRQSLGDCQYAVPFEFIGQHAGNRHQEEYGNVAGESDET